MAVLFLTFWGKLHVVFYIGYTNLDFHQSPRVSKDLLPFFCMWIYLPITINGEDCPFSNECSWPFYENSVGYGCIGYFLALYSAPLLCVSVTV
jgi:hypothetical protein